MWLISHISFRPSRGGSLSRMNFTFSYDCPTLCRGGRSLPIPRMSINSGPDGVPASFCGRVNDCWSPPNLVFLARSSSNISSGLGGLGGTASRFRSGSPNSSTIGLDTVFTVLTHTFVPFFARTSTNPCALYAFMPGRNFRLSTFCTGCRLTTCFTPSAGTTGGEEAESPSVAGFSSAFSAFSAFSRGGSCCVSCSSSWGPLCSSSSCSGCNGFAWLPSVTTSCPAAAAGSSPAGDASLRPTSTTIGCWSNGSSSVRTCALGSIANTLSSSLSAFSSWGLTAGAPEIPSRGASASASCCLNLGGVSSSPALSTSSKPTPWPFIA
eukprot:comp24167_c1_seq1/m.44076 comp24167_c1_seq1/g.44076  ORF comp24167_c1_seq1/g.44076 comp24167_c1_seq1/m.44076 type:complete len:324 (+) comp24167_c1_seq1:2468-3439(+)